jgi:hypothetical protein
LVANIARIEGRIVVALDDIKDGDGIPAREQGLHDVPTEETAAADDKESVAVCGGHGEVRDKKY